jgi:hypothetical protein
MNTTIRIAAAALSLIAAGTTFAAERAPNEPTVSPVSTLSRAEVRESVLQARAAGALRGGEADVQSTEVVVSQNNRDQVRTETLAALAKGQTYIR